MRIHSRLITVSVAAILAGCTPSKPSSAATTPPKADRVEISAADVAWATGVHVWKVACPSSDFDGLQFVVLDETGDAVAGAGLTLAVHHRPGQKTLLRAAFRIDGRSLVGRFSAGGISTDFHFPDVLTKEHRTGIISWPTAQEGLFVLAQEHAGETTAGPIARRIALRLVTDLGKGSR